MLPFNAQHANKEKISHADLAREQDTWSAVLPIHTTEEKALYRLLLSTNHVFSGPSAPNWVSVAQTWSKHVNNIGIFYKVSSVQSEGHGCVLTHFIAARAPKELPQGVVREQK